MYPLLAKYFASISVVYPDRVALATDEDIISTVQDKNALQLKADIKRAKAENAKANTEYESLKAEIVKAVQGRSKMPMDVLSELVDESRAKVMETSARLTELLAAQNEADEKVGEMRAELQQIRTWREVFDTSDMDVKKMIANYIIKRVNVYRDYELEIVLNINIQQYMDGLDSITAKHTA